jgi:hypothetical protein
MICYKDKTFCKYYETCGNACEYNRWLTKEVKDRALQLALPICQFTNKPDCWIEKPIHINK